VLAASLPVPIVNALRQLPSRVRKRARDWAKIATKRWQASS